MAPLSGKIEQNEPIAIIGSSCRFPGGATSPSKLWDLLREPRDVLREIPPSRFNASNFHHRDGQSPGHMNVTKSYLLDQNIAHFDAPFFSIPAAEAAAMDPQQRLLLETVYEGLESAGLTIEGLRGSNTGVYAGLMYGDYEAMQFRDLQSMPTYHGTGTARSIVSNRISYFFDWHGPSMTIDTACSSSLVALHQAVQALRSGQVDVALAAGTNLLLGPEPYIYESNLNMLSPDGRSRMWDEGVNGYARGEGVAVVVLKTLSAALAAGDTIDCIVRETGINQDGRSKGITMPSASAQVALIQDTYRRAGLDLTKEAERCQYFEAHGTGTPAGDPVEAEAVHTAFFGEEEKQAANTPLYVGSIKTIIGHTESSAGLAGVIKAAHAIRNGSIPPNRLLVRLNPRIVPFYSHLEVPQELTPWPHLPAGQPRRASVNSFGFGGTNAHVILESLEQTLPNGEHSQEENSTLFTPFVFSAQSKQSLIASLAAHTKFLQKNPNTNAFDLAWQLQTRRSRLAQRFALPASATGVLRATLMISAQDLQLEPKPTPSGNRKARLLGVFTGQGAQWPKMGAELISGSHHAAKILSNLDEALATLPADDRPPWTFQDEILAEDLSSKLGTAAIAQPICTAVQILLVDVLRLAGIEFSAVVGHSSGEIGAAYAAGYLTARDAIIIAYYRGFHSHLAHGPGGVSGAMLATSMSQSDAEELCSRPEYAGKVNLAACNSGSSVTLSGDDDAIDKLVAHLKAENKFVRRLRVDKAYHSHHMKPCADAYLQSMKTSVTDGPTQVTRNTAWASSVYSGKTPDEMQDVEAKYWVDNLLSPVLFKQAVEEAIKLGPFDAIIEVGPHPALKNPTHETLQDAGLELPYTSLLERQINSTRSISKALGYLWTQLDNLSIDFESLQMKLGGTTGHHQVEGLPSYQWNHGQKYWSESAVSKNIRLRKYPVHPLLGDMNPHSTPSKFIWNHVIRPNDIPWVHGHQIEGQTVFPAAGYLATAVESALHVARDEAIQLIEVENFVIHQALVLNNDDQGPGAQIQFSVTCIDRSQENVIRGSFTYEVYPEKTEVSETIAEGHLSIIIGAADERILPANVPDEAKMLQVRTGTFYNSLNEFGYGYTGPFRALGDLKRAAGLACGSIAVPQDEESQEKPFIVHPAVLDAGFHAIFAALGYPGDGKLRRMHLPTHVHRIRVNPALCESSWQKNHVQFVSSLSETGEYISGFQGDIEIHGDAEKGSAVQVEGLLIVPMAEPTAEDDRTLFWTMDWVEADPNPETAARYQATPAETELALLLERVSCFYLRQFLDEIPPDHPGLTDAGNLSYRQFAEYNTKLCVDGKHRYFKKEWLNDTIESIKVLTAPYSHLPEIRAADVAGEQMPRAVRGETNMVEQLLMTGLLDEYYAQGLGVREVTEPLANTVAQITKRHPQLRIMEVGAGTGGATREILPRIWPDFSSYTYTDVSSGFFGNAQDEFTAYKHKMKFSVLDLECDFAEQGYEKNSYDVVVASLVVHATKSLEQTMRRVRSLLRPGGYLVMSEGTNLDITRATQLFGCLPGWWLGRDEGRTTGPSVSEGHWDEVLRKTGFSGVDSMTATYDHLPYANSVIVSQAVDDWVSFLREPLLSSALMDDSIIKDVVLVGGSSFRISRIVDQTKKLLSSYADSATSVKTLEDVDHSQINHDSTIVVLSDLDQPAFLDTTEERFESIKLLFTSEKNIIWVTQNRVTDNPYSNAVIGFARSALWELPELRYQFVDFQGTPAVDARTLAELVLRFQAMGSAQNQKQRDMLWTSEHEIIIDQSGRQLIPRLQMPKDSNDRINSTARKIEKEISLGDSSAVVSAQGDSYVVNESPPSPKSAKGASVIPLRVNLSALRAVSTDLGEFFLVLGRDQNDKQVLTFSTTLASTLEINEVESIPVDIKKEDGPLFLSLIILRFVISHLSPVLKEGETIVLHNAPPLAAEVLKRYAARQGANVTFTTTSRVDAEKKEWIYLNPYARRSVIKSSLPQSVSLLLDFTTEPSPKLSLLSSLPLGARVASVPSALPATVINPLSLEPKALSDLSAHTTQFVEEIIKDLETWPRDNALLSQINIQDLSQSHGAADPFSILNWEADSVTATLQSPQVSLRADRTYWLAGLSGDLGLSIADWMVRSGARNLVISSRNPKIDGRWLDNAGNRGATVSVISCDVTDYESLQEAYKTISSTMPPVAGVLQGAMVLDDGIIKDMTLQQLQNALRPKVDGSLNLDRIFDEDTLDFFVFFSSTGALIGTHGQANYAAANQFMASLAQKRRLRGLAGSVIDIGVVVGIGYVTRELKETQIRALVDRGLDCIAESDVHYALAETISASRPETGRPWHLSTGLSRLPESEPGRANWFSYPEFACATLRETDNGVSEDNKQDQVASLEVHLAQATNEEQVKEIIKVSFLRSIRAMVQLGDDYEILPSTRTDELGLDSLTAVRIRSWFLKYFKTNIPTLKILGGVSLQELIEQAVEERPEALTPKLFADKDNSFQDDAKDDNESTTQSSDRGSSDIAESNPSGTASSGATRATSPQPEVKLIKSGRLSFTQSMFMFVHELLADKSTLNNSVLLNLRGDIRVNDLRRAVALVGENHHALRTCIYNDDGQIVQGVAELPLLALESGKIRRKDELTNAYKGMKNHTFDLARGQTLRIALLSYSSQDHYLLIGFHHVLLDRASINIIMAQLQTAYDGQSLEEPPLQYLEYSNQQQDDYSSGRLQTITNFWKEEFRTVPEPLPLTRSRLYSRRPLEKYASNYQAELLLSKEVTSIVRQVTRSHRSTPFHFYLATFKVLLFRFLGARDMCIGVADNGRQDDLTQQMVGPLLNTLPVRMEASADQNFSDALKEARQKSLAALTHPLPWEILLTEIQVNRHATYAPLAQAFLNYNENSGDVDESFLGCKVDVLNLDLAKMPYDIVITIDNAYTDSDTHVVVNVQEGLYTREDATLLAHGFEDMLHSFASDPNQLVGEKWTYRQEALDNAIILGKGPDFQSTWPETIVHRFDRLFPTLGERPAISDSHGAQFTYQQLSCQVDILAGTLISQGVVSGARVAVFQTPSVNWAVSVLAILKVGAVYVPLDAGTPTARLALIVKDSSPTIVLNHQDTEATTSELLLSSTTQVINIDKLNDDLGIEVPILAQPDKPAIILYTSGSTGVPKGVVLRHDSLSHEFAHCEFKYGLGANDVVLHQSAWSFDLSITQIFLALGVGARLHVISHLMRPDSHAIAKIVDEQRVTATYATPTEYKSWLRRENQSLFKVSPWRLALVAGEPVTEALLQQFREIDRAELRLFNIYGPTETTCGSTKMELDYRTPGFYQEVVPVGRASANECLYIADERQELQPVGQPGEVVIGGVGVALGYLTDDEKTKTSFLPDHFSGHGHTMMYRTGDRGYLLPDGQLVLVGRIGQDTEVKLNGVRTDLKDVEQTVLRIASGRLVDAIASLRDTQDGSTKYMVVLVVFSSESTPTEESEFLHQLLKDLPLPRPMLPSAIIPVKTLPRTVAGKIDRRAVASLSIPSLSGRSKHQESSVLAREESELRGLWRQVLPAELAASFAIERDSDFFHVGGSSMKLVELHHLIQERHGSTIALIELFQASTLQEMARLLWYEENEDGSNDIDWAGETNLNPDIPSPITIDSPPLTTPQVVVLTGATGFIGQGLLHALVAHDCITKVICLANRNLNAERKKILLLESGKVEAHEGDLSEPLLGLSPKDAERIFSSADAIIHNGADVSHLKTYKSLRPANLGSTKELARLALDRKVPLHFMSTTGVGTYAASSKVLELASVRDAAPPSDGLYGYIATKWASEVYLEEVHEHRGLPITIHRLSSVMRPDFETAEGTAADDITQNLIAYSRRVRAVPIMPNVNKGAFLDLVTAETTVNKIIGTVMGGNIREGLTYIHESGDLEIRIEDLPEYLKEQIGEPVQEVALDRWADLVEEAGLVNTMVAVFRGFGHYQSLHMPRVQRN